MQIQSLGQEDPVEEGIAAPVFSTRRIPWAEEAGGYGPWGHKQLDVTEVT